MSTLLGVLQHMGDAHLQCLGCLQNPLSSAERKTSGTTSCLLWAPPGSVQQLVLPRPAVLQEISECPGSDQSWDAACARRGLETSDEGKAQLPKAVRGDREQGDVFVPSAPHAAAALG